MRKLFFTAVCALLLSACVTEEGAKEHAAKQYSEADGLKWNATVYPSQRENAKTETIGEFDSRAKCMGMAMAHIKEKGYTEGAYSCAGV